MPKLKPRFRESCAATARMLATVCFPLCLPQFLRAEDPPEIAGCPVFPADNIWNTRVDFLPVDPNSAQYVATIGAGTSLHPDFGSGDWPVGSGAPIGIPYRVISPGQTPVGVSFDYADESDPGPYPIPPDAPIEGGVDGTGDRHVLLIDPQRCLLYELFYAFPQPDGSWHAGSGAIFDLDSNQLRPDTWTSADAAGLPIFPGLIRYEEVAAGEIAHALRFTAPQTRRDYLWPARHYASSLTGLKYPPMGQRFRLRNDFPVGDYSAPVQVVLRALQRYGMILADNGSPWYLSGAPDERWDNDVLRELRQVHGSDLEAVDVSALIVAPDSAAAGVPRPGLRATLLTPSSIELACSNLLPGATYHLERSTDLDLADWQPVEQFVPAQPSTTRSTQRVPAAAAMFYRLRP